jgi:hypothetical protein
MANLRDGYFGRSRYISQRLKRAISLAAAEDRAVVRPEAEQVLVSIVAFHQNALHLSLTLHRSPLLCEPFIAEFVWWNSEVELDAFLPHLKPQAAEVAHGCGTLPG